MSCKKDIITKHGKAKEKKPKVGQRHIAATRQFRFRFPGPRQRDPRPRTPTVRKRSLGTRAGQIGFAEYMRVV
jgi:hypothetical protein